MTEQVLTAPTVPQTRAVNIRGATMRAIYIIWKRDLIRYWRDRMRVVASLAQPVLFLFVFGSGLSSSLRGSTGGFGARDRRCSTCSSSSPASSGCLCCSPRSSARCRSCAIASSVPERGARGPDPSVRGGDRQDARWRDAGEVPGHRHPHPCPVGRREVDVGRRRGTDPDDLSVRLCTECARGCGGGTNAHHARVPDGDELPDDAPVLSGRRALPLSVGTCRRGSRC